MRTILYAMTVGVMFCARLAVPATTWYVDASVPKPGDGISWATALKKIQAGIDNAASGDTVIAARGTYVENINFKGKNIVLRSTNPADWAVVKQTIIDGGYLGSVVTFSSTEDESCVLSGFTLLKGTGTPTYFSAAWGSGNGGGGIFGGHVPDLTHATVQNNVITGNSCSFGGATFGVSGAMRNNVIVGNSAGLVGGALGLCSGVVEGNIIAGNSGYCSGGLGHCNATARNNVVVGNTATYHGGGLGHLGTTAYGLPTGGSITNCIIWGNTAPVGPQVYDSVAPTYCCIQDWTGAGQGNISVDPAFVDADGPDEDPATFDDNDYRLLARSLCIDAGTNENWMNGAVDLDGNPRILLGAFSITVDMGAYELRFALGILKSEENHVELSWTTRPARTYTVLSTSDMVLQPWTEETTILGGKTGGPAVWVDPGPSSPLKFYRLEIE